MRPVLVCEAPIYDCHPNAASPIRIFELAPRDHRRFERMEILGSYSQRGKNGTVLIGHRRSALQLE